MPAPRGSERDSKNDSKHASTGKDSHHYSSDRRERSKSTQIYDSARSPTSPKSPRFRDHRKTEQGEKLKHVESELRIVPERPALKSRSHSTPFIELHDLPQTQKGKGHDAETQQSGRTGTSTNTPSATAGASFDAQDEDEVAGVVGATRNFRPFQSSEDTAALPEINIAVIGADGVGKSTFVQKALDLPHPPPSQAAERKIPIDGSTYLVRLLELSIDDVDIDDDDNTVSWPETIEDKVMPKIDGALTLYDVKDKGSLENVRVVLNAIDQAELPSVLVSCKCDAPPGEREIDPGAIEAMAKRSLKSLNTLQASAANPESHKRGIWMILRPLLVKRSAPLPAKESASRRRAQSNAVRSVSPRPPPGHTRAASELTASLNKDQQHSRHDSSMVGYGAGDRLKVPFNDVPPRSQGSFLLEENADSDDVSHSDTSTTSAEEQQCKIMAMPPESQPVASLSENGATFDELVTRLLAQPISKVDKQFVGIFLALYRMFAPPGRLLEAIVQRFDAMGTHRIDKTDLIKMNEKQRYLSVLEQWVGSYPGDFAHPKTYRRVRTFAGKLALDPMYAVSSKEIGAHLDTVQDDDDTHWAYTDAERERRSDCPRISLSSTASTLIEDPSFDPFDDRTLSSSVTLDGDSTFGRSTGGGLGRYASVSDASTSSQLMLDIEVARRQAALLQPAPRVSITKMQWRQLIECPDDILAQELTRIDWTHFASIRPRDLVRYVSLSPDQKAQCKNTVHVNRTIEHFNQVALWVTNYVLFRDKPKHRALMLEKFMRIARKARELNDYSALGAIIAGISHTAVNRLGATRELIPQSIGKDWTRLELLMSSPRSYAPYRLAWENSNGERIPFLPVHLRDLTAAEQGNSTFVSKDKDGKINWRKFEIMGDVVAGLQKAQEMPYKGLGGVEGVGQLKELLLDIKLVRSDDDLDERSRQVEPTTAGSSSRLRDLFRR